MPRITTSPDATKPNTFTFSDPFVLKKAQGQVAYMQIFLGKSILQKGRAPKSPTNSKAQIKKFKRTSELIYKNLASVGFKDRVNKTDELTLNFQGLTYEEHTSLLGQLKRDQEVEMILGVRGLWHIKRTMIVRQIAPDYGVQIKISFTLHDTGAKASDGEQTKTFQGQKLSQILTGLARLAGMRAQIDIGDDPVIPHLSMGRRSVAKTVVDLADKYALATRFTNNVLYVQEFSLEDQPNAKYIFGGPRGNILRLSLKGSVSGLKGGTTTAKRRKANDKKEAKKAAGPPNDTLQITYKDNGSYTKRKRISFAGSSFSTKTPAARKKDKGRTVKTARTGADAARVAKGAHLNRTMKITGGSMTVINEPITPNTNLLIAGISDVFGGKFYAGDISYDWMNGVWKVSTKVTSQRMKKGSGKSKSKSQRGKNKKESIRTRAAKPRLLVTYKNNGSYSSRRSGYRRSRR